MGSMGDGSSRRGKKNNSDKPKQPQRGLGVAQLEKIRLQNQMMAGYLPSTPHSPFQNDLNKDDLRVQMAYPSSPSSSTITASSSVLVLHPHITMSFRDCSRTDMRYADPYSSATRSLHEANCSVQPQHLEEPLVTLPLFEPNTEKNRWHGRRHSASITNIDSSDSEEPDLELRLSL